MPIRNSTINNISQNIIGFFFFSFLWYDNTTFQYVTLCTENNHTQIEERGKVNIYVIGLAYNFQ